MRDSNAMLAGLVLASALGCLPDLKVTANQECFFGSTTAALHALETASRESGCSIVDGKCTCPTDQPDRTVCGNWAANLLRYYRPLEEDDDFVRDLSSNLASTCRTYGGLLLQENPPAEVRAGRVDCCGPRGGVPNDPPAQVPADTLSAACDRVKAPPAASTAGISLALTVGFENWRRFHARPLLTPPRKIGTSIYAVIIFESFLDDKGSS